MSGRYAAMSIGDAVIHVIGRGLPGG
jgi:hypothetical protein